jgi:hypothetical protein
MRSLPEFTNAVRLTTGPRADVRGPGVKSAVTFAWMCAGDGGGGRAREGADEAMRRRVLRAPSVAPATAIGFQRFTFVFALTNGYEATDVARRCDARDVTMDAGLGSWSKLLHDRRSHPPSSIHKHWMSNP